MLVLFVTYYNFLCPHMALKYCPPTPLPQLKPFLQRQKFWRLDGLRLLVQECE